MALEIKNLSKTFGDKVILNDFSYSFPDTGAFVIFGDSGTGKTTLLRMISGLDKDYSGKIIGNPISEISMSFQEYRLFPNLTALENITELSFANASEENMNFAMRMLLRLNFSDGDMNLYPDELSGGMKQRVSFVRAVCKRSSILLLDEATKELDKELSDAVLEIIKEEAKKRLVILVTHNENDIMHLGARVVKIQ